MKNRDKKENIEQENCKNQLEAELKVLREEISKRDDCQDRLLRLQAEFDNFRKRSIKERQEFIKYANEGLILELVGMLDNFERSIKAADQNQDFKLLHQGVDMISKQLHKLLEEKGLRKISSKGEQFDPNRHEAVEAVESDDAEEGIILEEFQPGYILNERVLRPAMVKVAKAKDLDPSPSAQDDKEEEEPESPDSDGEKGEDKT